MSPNFRLHRNLSALSVRSIRHVLCPPPTSSIITSPSLSSFFLILTLSLHFLHFFFAILFAFLAIFSAPYTFLSTSNFQHYHFSLSLSFSWFYLYFASLFIFGGVPHVHTSSIANFQYYHRPLHFLLLPHSSICLHFLYFLCISRKKQHQKDE